MLPPCVVLAELPDSLRAHSPRYIEASYIHCRIDKAPIVTVSGRSIRVDGEWELRRLVARNGSVVTPLAWKWNFVKICWLS